MLTVGVPGLVVAGAGANRDHAPPASIRPPREQQALAQMRKAAELASFLLSRVVEVEAKALADGGGLAGEVKGAAGGRRGDERIRRAVVGVEPGHCLAVAECAIEGLEQRSPQAQPLQGELSGKVEPWHAVAGPARVAGNEGIKCGAQNPAS